MNQDQSNRALNKQTPPTGSARPAESAALANAVRADSAPSSVLSINSGSSSIRFALYEKGESPRRLLEGKVDRVGLSGTNLTSTDGGRVAVRVIRTDEELMIARSVSRVLNL